MTRCCGAARWPLLLVICLAVALGLPGCATSKSPGAVVREFFGLVGSGRYEAASQLLTADAKAFFTFGMSLAALGSQLTGGKSGSMPAGRIEITREVIRGDTAEVEATFHYADGTVEPMGSNTLVMENGQWKIALDLFGPGSGSSGSSPTPGASSTSQAARQTTGSPSATSGTSSAPPSGSAQPGSPAPQTPGDVARQFFVLTSRGDYEAAAALMTDEAKMLFMFGAFLTTGLTGEGTGSKPIAQVEIKREAVQGDVAEVECTLHHFDGSVDPVGTVALARVGGQWKIAVDVSGSSGQSIGGPSTQATPSKSSAAAPSKTDPRTLEDTPLSTDEAGWERASASAPSGMAFIPPGSFAMGDSFGEGAASERPIHTVTVSAFYIERYEVTKRLWDEVAGWALAHGYDIGAADGDGRAANHPVWNVSWYEAVKWANARSEKEGLTPCYTVDGNVYRMGRSVPDCGWSSNGYRLPTEAEWERAARGAVVGHRFPWSSANTIEHSRANYRSTSLFSYDTNQTKDYYPTYAARGTSTVGSFAPNEYGLYDMTGNVWEWCWDWHEESYYSSSPESDPHGPASGSERVMRGGSWESIANSCRVANRSPYKPSYEYYFLGFRLVRAAEISGSPSPSTGALASQEPLANAAVASGTTSPRSSTLQKFVWPLQGAVVSPFGWRQHPVLATRHHHDGIDIEVPEGTTVRASAAGAVYFSGEQPGLGSVLILEHASDYFTLYGHLLRSVVVKGQHVEQGQEIALSGNSGVSSGPHLHFEIRSGDSPTDPAPLLSGAAVLPSPNAVEVGGKIGELAPDFSLQSLSGEEVTLSQSRGRVVILDFWASWCAPCRATMPNLYALWREVADRGVDLIGVSIDRTANAASAYLAAIGYEQMVALWESLSAAQSVAALYGVRAIPRTVVIDRDGIVRFNNHSAMLDLAFIENIAGPDPATATVTQSQAVLEAVDISEADKQSQVVVVVDPGHGGSDLGASAESVREKDVTLAVAGRMEVLAREFPNLRVVLTRRADVEMLADERIDVALGAGAQFCVALHVNAFSQPTALGIETVVDSTHKSGDTTWELAAAIQQALVASTGGKHRGVRAQGSTFAQLAIPAVSTLIGFITAPEERTKLVDPAYQDLVARGILQGILDYLATSRE